MATKTVDLHDFSDELGKFSKRSLEDKRKAVARGLSRAIPELVRNSPVDTGLYAQSWDFTVDERRGLIGNTAPHAPIIEYGARPFRPPLKPLLEWAKRVLQDPSQPPKYSPQVWALAIGTRNKIEIHGMKPKHVMENMIPKIVMFIKQEMERV